MENAQNYKNYLRAKKSIERVACNVENEFTFIGSFLFPFWRKQARRQIFKQKKHLRVLNRMKLTLRHEEPLSPKSEYLLYLYNVPLDVFVLRALLCLVIGILAISFPYEFTITKIMAVAAFVTVLVVILKFLNLKKRLANRPHVSRRAQTSKI